MMAQGVLPTPPTQPRRVKVYELKNNDWFDRGTGYCTGHVMDEVPHIQVKSEEESERLLLETKIIKEDGYQKQQETLIVWTEPNGTDMALSFQEPEGCAAIWEFVNHVQGMNAANADSVMLPPPELGNLQDIENMIRQASTNAEGRNSLGKFLLSDAYIEKLIPLLTVAEDLESLSDLHRLCNITKMIILLNDTVIIEHIVTDDVILGIVGMLEYDPDFPTHKANHRQYLSDTSKFKEVVQIDNPEIKKKIHWIYRLQYLKDVILARILDDPTFSVLNSLIFYHQVEVLQWIQNSGPFLKELFGIFAEEGRDEARRKDAVLFIQQCCQISKNIQPAARQPLYQTYIQHGLFNMIDYAMKSQTSSVRVAGMDIIMAMIDHDPQMMRNFVFKQLGESQKPITDTLIELLQAEKDYGVKAQVSDAIKVLLDPQTQPDFPTGDRRKTNTTNRFFSMDPSTEKQLKSFYDDSAKKLFAPLMRLDQRESVKNLTVSEVSLYVHLLEILWFFVRQHVFRSKFFIITEDLPVKIVRLLQNPAKHLKLAVVKLMRILVALRDSHFEKYLTKKNLLEPILDLVIDTMPKDNLLNSACLEFFEYIKRENIRQYVIHLAESHREKLNRIKYVDTFSNIILRAEQWNERQPPTLPSTPEDKSRRGVPHLVNGGSTRWQGVKELDANEEEYFNTSDDEDEIPTPTKESAGETAKGQGQSPTRGGRSNTPSKPLVDYPDDDTMEGGEETSGSPAKAQDTASKPINTQSISTSPPQTPKLRHAVSTPSINISTANAQSPSTSPSASPLPSPSSPQFDIPTPERLAEKRRRTEEDDDDELGKLSRGGKKRSSPSTGASDGGGGGAGTGGGGGGERGGGGVAISGNGSTGAVKVTAGLLQRKRSGLLANNSSSGSPPAKKIAISLGGGSNVPKTSNSSTNTMMAVGKPGWGGDDQVTGNGEQEDYMGSKDKKGNGSSGTYPEGSGVNDIHGDGAGRKSSADTDHGGGVGGQGKEGGNHTNAGTRADQHPTMVKLEPSAAS